MTQLRIRYGNRTVMEYRHIQILYQICSIVCPFQIVTEFFTIFKAIKLVSSEILIHHAKQRSCNFPSENKNLVFIFEKILSEKMKFY